MDMISVETDALCVGYDRRLVVEDIDIDVRRGEIITLIGPNGSGKSTILKTIAGQLEAVSGNVLIGGISAADLKGRELAGRVAVLLTDRAIPDLMTCREVVEYGRYPYTGHLGLLSAEDRAKTAEAMNIVNVSDLADIPFSRVSDGQRQRVMMARAVCQEPEILILDEPTSFLDMKYKIQLMEILKKLAEERGTSVIMTLHETSFAERISDRVLCIKNGRVDRFGDRSEVFTEEYMCGLYDIDAEDYRIWVK